MRKHLQPRRLLGNLVVLALLAVWFLTLAPTVFGGPAAYIKVSGHSMDGTYRTGDLVVTRTRDTYEVGDIVVFKVSGGQVIHRVIGGKGTTGYTLQGDNNPDPDPWHPTDADVVGRAWFHYPDSAWVFDLPRNPLYVGLAAGLFTLVVLAIDAAPHRRPKGRDDADDADEAVLAGATR
jgi:signal peptidase